MKCLRYAAWILVLALFLSPVSALAGQAADPDLPAEAGTTVRAMVLLEEGAALSPEYLTSAVPGLTVARAYSELFSGYAVDVSAGALETLEALPGVAAAWVAESYEAPSLLDSQATVEAALLRGAGEDAYSGQGVLAAVLDTGAELSHAAFRADNPLLGDPALTERSAALSQTFAAGRYVSAKVPFAYDYGDADSNVSDSSGHGTAVAGRLAGYDGSYSGAAPGAQLAIMKVYSDKTGTAASDRILAALEDAYVLGADVICIAFGQPCGFSRTSDTEAAVYGDIFQRLEEAGIIVCCAAGDNGSQADHDSVTRGSVLANYADFGLVSSPASLEGNVSVAAAESAEALQYVLEVGRNSLTYTAASDQGAAFLTEALGGQQWNYVLAGYGDGEDYTGLDAAGAIAVVRRSGTIHAQALAAMDAGAAALIVISSQDTPVSFWAGSSASGGTVTIPVIMISSADGQLMENASLKTLYIPREQQLVSTGADISIRESSSRGPAPSLNISPNISAVGEAVLAPDRDGGYTYRAGTDMAAAEVAGDYACLLSRLKASSSLDKPQRADAARGMLTSTAGILYEEDVPVSVRRQGAGLADLSAALESSCYITGPLQALGDDPEETGVFSMALTIRNAALEQSGCPSRQFADVRTTDWFHESVDYVVSEGLFNGMSETVFSPNTTLTRAQIVTVLYRMEGQPETRAQSSFQDVPAGSYYEKAVSWAQDNGIVYGKSAVSFAPNDPVTREQMVTFLYRYNQYSGMVSGEAASLRNYQDADQVSAYAVTAMGWAVDQGIVNSTSTVALVLSPKDSATRAQFATILTRFLGGNPVIASYTPYSLVMGDETAQDADGVTRNLLTAGFLDYDVTFSCGDTLTMNRWTEEKTVTVTIQLSDACRRRLRSRFENGAFVEGYVGFRSEGGDIHAAFLGFFGDWTDGPVLETVDFQDILTAGGKAGSISSYLGALPMDMDANLAFLLDGKGGVSEQLLGANPAGGSGVYLADRCALSTSPDALTHGLWFGVRQLRNAGSVTAVIRDRESGKIYFRETRTNSRKSTYENGSWCFAQSFQWKGTDLQGRTLSNGTEVTVSVYAAPEGGPERLEWQFTCAIDAAAPTVTAAKGSDGTITVSARDDRYLASLTLQDGFEQTIRQETYADSARGVTHTLTLSEAELAKDWDSLVIVARDYAGNQIRLPAIDLTGDETEPDAETGQEPDPEQQTGTEPDASTETGQEPDPEQPTGTEPDASTETGAEPSGSTNTGPDGAETGSGDSGNTEPETGTTGTESNDTSDTDAGAETGTGTGSETGAGGTGTGVSTGTDTGSEADSNPTTITTGSERM